MISTDSLNKLVIQKDDCKGSLLCAYEKPTYTIYPVLKNTLFFLKQVLFGIINNCVGSVEYLCGLSDLWPPFPLAVFFWRCVFVAGLNECNMSLSRGARTIFPAVLWRKTCLCLSHTTVRYSRPKCVIITSFANPA